MTTLMLPGTSGPIAVPLNLALVEALEQDMNLLQVAEKLAAHDMKMAEIIGHLQRLYRAAGCTVTDEFLLTQAPAALLADILLAVLTPLAAAGAIDREKKS